MVRSYLGYENSMTGLVWRMPLAGLLRGEEAEDGMKRVMLGNIG